MVSDQFSVSSHPARHPEQNWAPNRPRQRVHRGHIRRWMASGTEFDILVARARFEPATVGAEFQNLPVPQGPAPGWCLPPASPAPEDPAPPRARECWIPVAFPAPVRSGPNSLRHFRDRQKSPTAAGFCGRGLVVRERNDTANILSEGHFLSEAWGLANLLYKLFSVPFQRSGLIAQPKVGIPLPHLGHVGGSEPFAFKPQAA